MKICVFHCLRHFQLILATTQMTMSTGTVDHCDDATLTRDDATLYLDDATYRDAMMMCHDVAMMSVLLLVEVTTLVSFRVALTVTLIDGATNDECDDCDAVAAVHNFDLVVVVEVDRLTIFVPNRSARLIVKRADSVDGRRVDLEN